MKSPKELTKLTRRMFDEIWNEKNPELFDEFYAEDYVAHGNRLVADDLHGAKEWYELIVTAFPDVTFDLDRFVAEDDLVTVTWSATGTHEAPFMGFEPTRKTETIDGITVLRFDDDVIAEGWMEYDAISLLQAIDAFPERPAPA